MDAIPIQAFPSSGDNSPLVSVVLPTYNGAAYLRNSLASCLGQTYARLEVIVVVDGSQDQTLQVLQEFSDPRLVVVCHERNRGLSAALNTGFGQARGTYLTWTSDDNFYAPDAVERLVRFLQADPSVQFAYADFYEVDEKGQVLRERRTSEPEALRRTNPVACCFLYHRTVMERVGPYHEDARLAEDFEYWVRVYRSCRMAHYPGALYYYRIHSGSLSGKVYNKYEALRVCARARRKFIPISRRSYFRQMAAAYIEEAFARYRNRALEGVPGCVVKGLAYDPAWLTNRGVIAILARSICSIPQRGLRG